MVRVNPNGMDALRAVDVHQAVIAESFPLVRVGRVTAAGRRVGGRLAADPTSERGLPRVMHWSALSRVLRDEAASRGTVFRHGGTVVDVLRTTGGVTAVLDDGDRVEGDVLLGADGVRSRAARSVASRGILLALR